MKKRLRKKLGVGEFFEPFFEVTGTYAQDLSEEVIDSTFDQILDLSDSLNLSFWGNFSGCGFFSDDYKKPITKEQRQKVYDFFDTMYNQGVVLTFQMHETVDTYKKYLQWEKENR